MITLNNHKLLSKKEAHVILRHVSADISYGEGGSFNKENKRTGEFPFDKQEAVIAENALHKIRAYLTQ